MEVNSELLWKATSAILLCFLVARLVSLLLSFSTPPTEIIREKGYKRISAVDLDHDHDRDRDHHLADMNQQKKIPSSAGSKKKKKRVKFLDLAAKAVDSVNEIQVNAVFASENSVRFEGGGEISDGKEEGAAKAVEFINKIQVKGGSTENRENLGGIEGSEGMLTDEEGWEGIEKSELEIVFGRARDFIEFAEKERRFSTVGNDLIMQLYGLMKVAMEGPCYEPQPMALKLSARAKWNAWQRLGNMSPEEAMEKYISLLSDIFPEWMNNHSSVEIERPSKEEEEEEEAHSLQDANTKRTSELRNPTDISTPVNKNKAIIEDS